MDEKNEALLDDGEERRLECCDLAGDEELLFLEEPEYDAALIGVVEGGGFGPVALYDRDEILAVMQRAWGMTEEEALDHFGFNIMRSLPYMGDRAPAFLTPLYMIDDEADLLAAAIQRVKAAGYSVFKVGRDEPEEGGTR